MAHTSHASAAVGGSLTEGLRWGSPRRRGRPRPRRSTCEARASVETWLSGHRRGAVQAQAQRLGTRGGAGAGWEPRSPSASPPHPVCPQLSTGSWSRLLGQASSGIRCTKCNHRARVHRIYYPPLLQILFSSFCRFSARFLGSVQNGLLLKRCLQHQHVEVMGRGEGCGGLGRRARGMAQGRPVSGTTRAWLAQACGLRAWNTHGIGKT